MITEITLEEGERIRIGENIVLTIVKVGDDYSVKKVRIGIEAPLSISIVRGELVGDRR